MLYITILFSLLFLIATYKIAVDHNGVRLHNFDIRETLPLRGILALCVFLNHLSAHLDAASPWVLDFEMFGTPSVACFFLLGGYGLAYSVKTKGASYLDGFFRKRLTKLLWPFTIVIIIYQLYRMMCGTFSWYGMLVEPLPFSWFIYALLVWYIGFYLCFKNSRSHKMSIAKVWLFNAIYMTVTIKLHLGYYWVSILPMPIALTYVFYEDDVKDFICRHPKLSLIATGGLFIGVIGYTLFAIYVRHLPGWGPMVYNTLPIWVVFLTYVLGGAKNVITNFLGRISYEIYIVHGFVVMLLADIIIVSNPHLNSISVILLLFSITALSAWGLNLLSRKITYSCYDSNDNHTCSHL